jgi:hypothetical protein
MIDEHAQSLDRENPWPGLMPFTESAREFFHGRDAEAADLARRVRRVALTVLFGQSGLGKTSLLQAGLFPRLRAGDLLPVYIRLDFNANPAPVEQITAALASNLEAHGVDGPKSKPGETLWAYFHDKETEFWSRRNRLITPVLVFDQFEEILTLGHGARWLSELLDELAALVENRPPPRLRDALETHPEVALGYDFAAEGCKIVLTLREDFLAEFEGLRRLMPSIMHNRMRLARMDGVQARDVILRSGSHLVAPGVAEQIVRFVAAGRGPSADAMNGEPDLGRFEIEPALLSIVCRELNNQRLRGARPQITTDLLEGAQSEIIAQFYTSSVAGLDPAVKIFVEDQLLTADGYRDTRPLAEALLVPGVDRTAIDRLVAGRLLRIEERFGTQWVELAHDLLTGVIGQQRDARREAQEAKAQRQRAERAEADAAEQAAVARRTRIALAVTAALLLVVIGALIFAWHEHRRAEEARWSYALAPEVATRSVDPLAIHYSTGEISTALTKALLERRPHDLQQPARSARGHHCPAEVCRLFINLAEVYRTFRLAASVDTERTAVSLAERLPEASGADTPLPPRQIPRDNPRAWQVSRSDGLATGRMERRWASDKSLREGLGREKNFPTDTP